MGPDFISKLAQVDPGQVITVIGKTKSDTALFSVNLTEDVSEHDTDYALHGIPLHFGVRFDEKAVIRNTRSSNAKWGVEERSENIFDGNESNPLTRGDHFKITIYCDVTKFFISMNDKPFCIYDYRLELSKIKWLDVRDGFESIYQVKQNVANPKLWPEDIGAVHRFTLPNKFKIGDEISLKGTIHEDSEGMFYLNLFNDAIRRTFFKIRVYMKEKYFNITSQSDEHYWMQNMRFNDIAFPFQIGKPFAVIVKVFEDNFELEIDGESLRSTPFRVTERIFSSLDSVEIISQSGTIINIKSFNVKTITEKFDLRAQN